MVSLSPKLSILATSTALGIITATADWVTAATVNMELSFSDSSGKKVGTGSFSYDDSSPIDVIDGGQGKDIQVGTIKKWFYVKSFEATVNNMSWGLQSFSLWDSVNNQPKSISYNVSGQSFLKDLWLFDTSTSLSSSQVMNDDRSFTQILASGESVGGFWAATEIGTQSSDAVPEAPTILGSLTAIGMLILFKRSVSVSKKT